MGSCYAKHPKNEGNMDIKPKDNSAFEYTQINSELTTNRRHLQQPLQAQGDQLLGPQIAPNFPIVPNVPIVANNQNNQNMQLQQQEQAIVPIQPIVPIVANIPIPQNQNILIQQQQANQIQGNQNIFNERIIQLLSITDQFNLTQLRGQLIYMIHRECEQFRNFFRVDNNQFEEFINMFLQQRLEYLNYDQAERDIIIQINQQLPQDQQIRTLNKFIGQRKLQQISANIRNQNLLMRLKQLEYIPQDAITIKSEILKATDFQINQNKVNLDNLKKLLFVKEFYVCLLHEREFILQLEQVDYEKLMLNF